MPYLSESIFIFVFIFVTINCIFREYRRVCSLDDFFEYVLFDNWMKSENNLRVSKVQSQGLLSICLIFCQFKSGVAYKSAAYKKACSEAYCRKASVMLRVSHNTSIQL